MGESLEETQFYLKTLSSELKKRREKVQGYSLRSFAKALEIDAGTLSRLLNGKQIPTYAIATRLTRKLKLLPEQESEFFKSISRASEKK